MNTTRVRIDPDDPSTLPEGRIDPARVDATTEGEIAAQEREDEYEAMQDMARYARRVRRRLGLSQTELARRTDVPLKTIRNWEQGKRCPTGAARALFAHARQGSRDRAPRPDLKAAPDWARAAQSILSPGYHSKENVERCERQGIEPYIAGSREHHNQPLAQRMQAPPACPADADAVTAMQYRLQTAAGKAIYSKRKATVETVFGVIKEVLGFRRFHLRGVQAVRGEWSLVCTAWNLKRLYVLAG